MLPDKALGVAAAAEPSRLRVMMVDGSAVIRGVMAKQVVC